MNLSLKNLEETRKLGMAIGAEIRPGDVIGLVGDLGAGKTALTRAIAEGMCIPSPLMVTSPTFVLINEYPTTPPLYHFDFYRLKSASELLEIGFEEYIESDGVCVIEWADRFESLLPQDRLMISLNVTGESTREAILTSFGDRPREFLESLKE